MKKLSLFSLLGLTGLLAFVVTPIYAQEDDAALEEEEIVAEAEGLDVNVEDEFNYLADENGIALENADDEITVEWDTDWDEIGVLSDVDDSINDVDDSINEIMWFLDDGESLDVDDTDIPSFELKIWDRAIHINPITFFFSWIWLAILAGLIIWLILCHISLWRIFGRAWEWKWKSLIPFYNLYIVFKISDIKNWFWYIILVALIAGILSAFFPAFEDILDEFSTGFSGTVVLVLGFILTKKFGRSNNGSILYTLFSLIWILVLWLWNYKYQWTIKKEHETIVEA